MKGDSRRERFEDGQSAIDNHTIPNKKARPGINARENPATSQSSHDTSTVLGGRCEHATAGYHSTPPLKQVLSSVKPRRNVSLDFRATASVSDTVGEKKRVDS